MVTTIYLVRHAEAAGNREEFFQGNIETELTEKGKKQLQCLAERFREISITALISSPQQRALLTAEAVNAHHGLQIQQDENLREIHGGKWEGVPWAELPERFPEEYKVWTENMAEFHAPEGESMREVYARMVRAMERIAKRHFGETIAVVSHGCALRNFLCHVEFREIGRLADVGWADNTAVSLVEYDRRDGWRLFYKNDASHLPAELSSLRGARWAAYERKDEDEK